MGGDKLKIVLSLTPPLLIIGTLFFGGILYGFLQSLGYQPSIGKYDITLLPFEDYIVYFLTPCGLRIIIYLFVKLMRLLSFLFVTSIHFWVIEDSTCGWK